MILKNVGGGIMREMEFKMERQGLLEIGQQITVTEGVLPSGSPLFLGACPSASPQAAKVRSNIHNKRAVNLFISIPPYEKKHLSVLLF